MPRSRCWDASTYIGNPEVEKHLYALIALKRVNSSWDRFYRLLQRAFPKLNSTIELNLRTIKASWHESTREHWLRSHPS